PVSLVADKTPTKENLWNSDAFRDLLRKDFKETLFFKNIETDENGNAEITFTTSDTLSTYHITAVAYAEDSFGKAESDIIVTRDLYLEELLPEFARKGDRFKAGVQVSNRTTQALDVDLKLKVEPQGMLSFERTGPGPVQLQVPSKGNKTVDYNIKAVGEGEAELYFYAASEKAKDALLKKIPVTASHVTDFLLDFDCGKTISKHIAPTKKAKNGGRLKLNVTPSILKPAGHIARKLIFYSYECMEQRASKVMPFLILDHQLLTNLGIGINKEQVRESIREYVGIIPEFMTPDGGLSYFRSGKYTSDYLTIYVYWSLQLAMDNGFAAAKATGIKNKLENYLKEEVLSDTDECFFQFVRSLNKKAEPGELERQFEKRKKSPLIAQVFLYRAINNQLGEKAREKTNLMLPEFMNRLRVETDYAYFDGGVYTYKRDWPFYSARYATALIFQAILEVAGRCDEAFRI
ncbi:MAG: hypothetical protein GY757_31955, partial [bacterium]|nr:hypothetical protein [bacterium]